MEIIEQQVVANHIISKLEVIDPYCILAGGAPRDWYFGVVANDLDFYYYSSADTVVAAKRQLESAICRDIEVLFDPSTRQASGRKDTTLELYKTMKDLRRIFEADIDGVKVQFMQLQSPKGSFNVIEQMSVSICKAWYKNGKTTFHNDFKLSCITKVMFLSDGYSWDDPHPSKIKVKFKSFACGSKDSATRSLVRKQLLDF